MCQTFLAYFLLSILFERISGKVPLRRTSDGKSESGHFSERPVAPERREREDTSGREGAFRVPSRPAKSRHGPKHHKYHTLDSEKLRDAKQKKVGSLTKCIALAKTVNDWLRKSCPILTNTRYQLPRTWLPSDHATLATGDYIIRGASVKLVTQTAPHRNTMADSAGRLPVPTGRSAPSVRAAWAVRPGNPTTPPSSPTRFF